MARTIHNKLVRDGMPQVVARNGETCSTRILSDSEYQAALRTKLAEEASEVGRAKTREDLIAELADLQEVQRALLLANGIIPSEVEEARIEKAQERGIFEKRIFLEWTE